VAKELIKQLQPLHLLHYLINDETLRVFFSKEMRKTHILLIILQFSYLLLFLFLFGLKRSYLLSQMIYFNYCERFHCALFEALVEDVGFPSGSLDLLFIVNGQDVL